MSIVHSDEFEQFQQDSATPHTSRVATKWLYEHSSDFRYFHCPPKSPDMNIIEPIPDSNFSLQQACHKFVMTRVQVCYKFVMTSVQACSKLAAS
ncbi:hypothetical protein AVEN_220716-1 [Araneus ventricosus]|uniref:Tc1-like transposase DDE domain-containing protein n=1 Tax=Araneus ventricosus TaxID=182803 RepID=A0A4Y2SHI6_ARAVE|nr:hypothetical protein AVEN_245690-1 [Araneus ventricosus]GBN87704.1 hypothetical protein AVEN_220716-1 [Araneus ventricosus]